MNFGRKPKHRVKLVKLTLVLSKIAEQEKVEVTNEDLARVATQEAMMMRKDPTAYIKELSKDRRQVTPKTGYPAR